MNADPDNILLFYLIIFLIIFILAYYVAGLYLGASLILAVIVGLLALLIKCPLSSFDRIDEYKNHYYVFGLIYLISFIIIVVYAFYYAIISRRPCSSPYSPYFCPN